MTATPITRPPNPAAVAEASRRLRASQGLAPSPLTGGRRVTFAPPRELRPIEAAPAVAPAVERDRARWADCSRGAHVWITTPMRVVCAYCPVPEDQAARVQATRRARA